MPKAAMDKNDSSVLREHDVRASRQALAMEPEAEATTVQKRANYNFRPGVFPSDTRHHSAAGQSIDNVCHCSLRKSQVESELLALAGLTQEMRPHRTSDRLDQRNDNGVSKLLICLGI
jgi:hypothetical protein